MKRFSILGAAAVGLTAISPAAARDFGGWGAQLPPHIIAGIDRNYWLDEPDQQHPAYDDLAGIRVDLGIGGDPTPNPDACAAIDPGPGFECIRTSQWPFYVIVQVGGRPPQPLPWPFPEVQLINPLPFDPRSDGPGMAGPGLNG